jgi:hypothetical protein
MRLALLIVAALAPLLAFGAACSARSAAYTTAFVELYTSEGCNSCPPADRWLSGIAKSYPRERVVPLALHVDYWDYIGWKDPYARREFSQRQRRLSQLQRVALVYTPQVVLQGADFRAWGGPEFDRAVQRINGRPASAHLSLAITGRTEVGFRVQVDARADAGEEARVYLAAYESGLSSQVSAGENRGRRLAHDYVALEWQGPYALGPREIALALLPKAQPADSGVAAFVQNRRTGEVLQALMLGACAPQRFE